MSLDPTSVGAASAVFKFRYDWRTLVLYALGIGTKREELDYLYEARGPKVFPTFGVVPAYPVLMDLLGRSGGTFDRLVHAGQSVTVHAAIPASGELSTTGVITGIYDLKKMAQLVFRTQTTLDGQLVFENEWSMLLLGEGGFGGPRPPKSPILKIPNGALPDFVFEERISPEQALLYRLSGDPNPLHADPAFAKLVGFERGPILHGLATYGFCARALVLSALGGDATRLATFHGQFRKPVWPGDVLRTEGFALDGQLALRASAGEGGETVALFGAELRSAGAGI